MTGMTTWPYHDEHPASGDWPGGARYGYEVHRELREREWTDEEQWLAERRDVELPGCDYAIIESWHDLPQPVAREVAVDVPLAAMVSSSVPTLAPSDIRTRTARTFGSWQWLTDPAAIPRFRIRRIGYPGFTLGWAVEGRRRHYATFYRRRSAERWVVKHRQCTRCDECGARESAGTP